MPHEQYSDRKHPEFVVLDPDGRCVGTVCVGDVIHGAAQMTALAS